MTKAARLIAILTVFILLVIAGCRRQQSLKIPRISYGQDACAFCHMTIDDPRFAAALIYRNQTGQQRTAIFDDIGCMLAWQREHPTDTTVVGFVHDFKTSRSITATKAWYLHSATIQTPMGWGIAAGASSVDAQQAAPTSELKPMTFEQLLASEKTTKRR